MKKITVIILLAALCGLLTAQVTIGSDKAPVSGSLLQLKENETTDGSANTTHGLGMPRVKLTSKTNLYPMFELLQVMAQPILPTIILQKKPMKMPSTLV